MLNFDYSTQRNKYKLEACRNKMIYREEEGTTMPCVYRKTIWSVGLLGRLICFKSS